ncbi:MAG TPA: kelch repeat-containing protein, partial [Thermoplasmata archaeon]|nr:kelch repeat-containing protein [Thermoplasmata archaeon]
MVYDPADGYVVLFGGFEPGIGWGNDTWRFFDGNWTQIHPSVSPPQMADASMAWDPADGYIVLFGGDAPFVWPYLGTWTFVHGEWSNLSTLHAPPERWNPSLAWDARDGYLVLFGGRSNGVDLNDTWTFLNGDWSQLSSRSPPPAREGAAMTYDSGLGRIVMFGGVNLTLSAVMLNDTWEFSEGTWTPVSTVAAPSGRSGAGLAYFPPLGIDVLYGGFNYTPTVWNDTWWFQDGQWTLAPGPLHGSPAATATSAMVYDPTARDIVAFGDTIPGTWAYYTINLKLGATPSSGDAPLNVTFAASPSDGVAPYQLNWTLDDGS